MEQRISSAWIPIVLSLLFFSQVLPADAPRSGTAQVRTTVPVGWAAAGGEAGLTPDGGKVELTLEDAVTLALERNLSLIIQRYGHSQTLQGLREALGIFDLDLNVNMGFDEDSRATTSTLEDIEGSELTTEGLNADFGLSQLVASGGRVGLDFNNSRSSSSNRNDQPNPSFFVNLGLSFRQPLLRGFGREITRQGILVARNQNEISREDLQLRIEEVVARISGSYWDLVEARNQLRVAEESLELVQATHEMNVLREEAGVLAPLEVTRSEADVATQEEDIIGRRADVEDRTDELRGLLNLDRGALWEVEIVPVTDPELEPLEIDVEAAIEAAFDARPELRRLRLANTNLAISARAARNTVRPQLDLQARWSINAVKGDFTDFGDDPDDVPVVIEENDYFDTLEALFERDFEGWGLSLQFSYPLQNRQAKARKAQAELALEQSELTLKQLEQQVMIEVRRAARAVDTASRQIRSARRSSELAKKTLEVEELSYGSGQSSGFEILESQERLRDARSREASAVTAYRRALTGYHQAIGRLLEENGIELAKDDSE